MKQHTIAALEQTIRDDYDNIAGVVVRKDGETAYEGYFHGGARGDALHVYSVTKSVFSALIGIAIDRGDIVGVDQRVADFFPACAAKDVTIRHLLTMTAPYTFEDEPFEAFFESADWVAFALAALGGGEAGRFRYSPIVGAHILSGILAAATGRPILDFARENLFTPLGIDVPCSVALPSREAHIAFGSGANARGWAADPQGLNAASWGLCLTAADMAKIGQLYLGDGAYGGRRIVSEAWVRESTRPHSLWAEMGLPYGYLWWILGDGAYAAMGDGGNVIYVSPARRLVVAIASRFMPDAKDRLALIEERVLPIF